MRIAIVEDYPPVAKSLARMVESILGDRLQSLKFFRTTDSVLGHLDEHPIDLLFLDLDLGGEDGFEILKAAAAESFFTIIVSANTERALESYEYGVLDFVGKPVDRERLARALSRLDDADKSGTSTLRYLSIKSRNGVELVAVDSVLFIQGAGKYSEIHLENGAVELHDKNLERIEVLLPSSFRRVHKSYVVNMARAIRIHVQAGGSYALELSTGDSVPVGRSRYREIKDELI